MSTSLGVGLRHQLFSLNHLGDASVQPGLRCTVLAGRDSVPSKELIWDRLVRHLYLDEQKCGGEGLGGPRVENMVQGRDQCLVPFQGFSISQRQVQEDKGRSRVSSCLLQDELEGNGP